MSLGRGAEETHRGVTLISGRAPDTAAADTGRFGGVSAPAKRASCLYQQSPASAPGPRSGHSVAGSHARGTQPCVLATPLPGEAGCVLRALRALAPVPGAAPASPRLSAATSQQVQPRAESKAQGAAAGAAGLRKSRDQLERRRCPLHPPRPHPNLPYHPPHPPTPRKRRGTIRSPSRAPAARPQRAGLIN